MSKGAPDWSRLMRFWDGTTLATQLDSTPVFRLAEIPALQPGSADIGTINTKYFPITPTKGYTEGASVVVGSGDATKTSTITQTYIAWVNEITIYSSSNDAENTIKVELTDDSDVLQDTLIKTASDIGTGIYKFKIPYQITAGYKLVLTYTNGKGIATDVGWNVNYIWAGTYVLGTVIDSWASPTAGLVACTYAEGSIWTTSTTDYKIFQLNPATGAEIASYSSPSNNPVGITFDGTHLRVWEPNDNKIYRIDTSDGSEVDSITTAFPTAYDLAWDGSFLWQSIQGANKIFKINPANGAKILEIPSPTPNLYGLTWVNGYLWGADLGTDRIYKINPFTGVAVDSFTSPGLNPAGLAWDGTYLWVASSTDDKMYKVQI